MKPTTRIALYCRCSTLDQHPEAQLAELERYCDARGWTERKVYTDAGISGSKESRPALDALMQDARRRKFNTLLVWRLDRLGRNLRHLVTMLDELQALGVAFVSLGEGIDCTTPAGKLQLHILAALADFERARIAERVRMGMQHAKSKGKHVGRPRRAVTREEIIAVQHLSLRQAAAALGISKSCIALMRASIRVIPDGAVSPQEIAGADNGALVSENDFLLDSGAAGASA